MKNFSSFGLPSQSLWSFENPKILTAAESAAAAAAVEKIFA